MLYNSIKHIKNASDNDTFTDDDRDDIIASIYAGSISVYNLPTNLYNYISKKLDKIVLNAFGLKIKPSLENPDFETIKMLRRNVYEFSAAKEFHQVKDIQSILFDERGFKKNFSAVKKQATDIFDNYNKNYLKTESQTARKQARMAQKWQRIQDNKDLFPYLQYRTIGDGRVRDEHAVLDNVIKRADDAFWQNYYPSNGWNCRCTVIQLRSGEVTDDSKIDYANANVDDLFKSNAGVKGDIFNKAKHPYFEVDERFKTLKSKNFGLQIPKDLQ